MEAAQFTLDFKVRDYECDLQGIVNNSVYQQYLEHTRHEFLHSKGIDFADLAARGIHLVVTRVEIDYKRPLTSGDTFRVSLNLIRASKVRFQFLQNIYRLPDETPVIKGVVTATALNERGRPSVIEEVQRLFEPTDDEE